MQHPVQTEDTAWLEPVECQAHCGLKGQNSFGEAPRLRCWGLAMARLLNRLARWAATQMGRGSTPSRKEPPF